MHLIILRGLPGSGKSFIANALRTSIGKDNTIICSADHFMVEDGQYVFKPEKLGYAHNSCFAKAKEAIDSGQNVIVDNTNTMLKEFRKYSDYALEKGYHVWLIEPKTEWKNDVDTLVWKNTHDVPRASIEKMLARYQSNETCLEHYKSAGKSIYTFDNGDSIISNNQEWLSELVQEMRALDNE